MEPTRDIPANILHRLGREEVRTFYLLEMTIDAASPDRFTNCDVPIAHKPTGQLFMPRGFNFSPTEFGQQQVVETLQVEIDNLDDRFTSKFFGVTPQGSPIVLYSVVLSENFHILGDRVMLFRGTLDDWSLDGTRITFTAVSALVSWSQVTLTRHGKSCRWKEFTGVECSYSGAVTHCDRTYETCESLGNTNNFGGFRWLPELMNKDIYFGRDREKIDSDTSELPSEDYNIAGGSQYNTRSSSEPLKILYGEYRIGGNDIYAGTMLDSDDVLWVVQTLAVGECEGLSTVEENGVTYPAVYLNGELFTQTGTVVEGAATATVAGRLQDTNVALGFLDPKYAGKLVDALIFNTTAETDTTIIAVDNSTDLSLAADIFASGDEYIIRDVDRTEVIATGTATATVADKLRDSTRALGFQHTDYTNKLVGSLVFNTTDSTYTRVTAIHSTTELTLVDDIFVNGETYKIFNTSFYFHAGTSDQVVDTAINAAIPGFDDPMHYTAYIVYKFVYDQEFLPGKPTCTVTLKGLKILNFVTEVTAYSTNAVLCLYDYFMSKRYGAGLNLSDIDLPTWTLAYDYAVAKAAARGWALNMFVSREEAAADVRDNILKTFRGQMSWWSGKYYLRYKDLNDEASVFTILDEHNLRGDDGKAIISIDQKSKFQKPDGLRVTFVDAEKGWISDTIPIGDETGAIDEINVPGITGRKHALDIGVYTLERLELDRVISGTFRDDLIELNSGNIVTFNSTALSIADQLMRVLNPVIRPDGLIDLTLAYEALTLYDDDYEIVPESVYTSTLPDPKGEPPSVRNVVVTEEVYFYREQSYTRIKVTFDKPLGYPWFQYIEFWLSLDGVSYKHQFNPTTDFQLDPVEEGTDYWLRLRIVSIWGTKQTHANAYLRKYEILGKTDVPVSVTSLEAIVNQNCINLYSQRVDDPDVEWYEFRLGSSWLNSIFLAASRAPNYSLTGVRPSGNPVGPTGFAHTFLVNTLATNKLYGTTPRAASVTILDPPDSWTVQGSFNNNTLITNGSMEADANWANYGTPTTNARSNEQVYDEIWSRKFVSNGAGDGIKSDVFTTVDSGDYGAGLWIYPVTATKVRVRVRAGDNSGYTYDNEFTGLTAGEWNEVFFVYSEGAGTGGAGAYIAIYDGAGDAGTWYVDAVCLISGTFDNTNPIMYSGTACIKCSHTGGVFVGTYTSSIYDAAALLRRMWYIVSPDGEELITVIGAGGTWDDVIPIPDTWDDLDITRTWVEIFELDAGSDVGITLTSDDGTPPTADVSERMEILSTIQYSRYQQMTITITDPSDAVHAYVKYYTLKHCT